MPMAGRPLSLARPQTDHDADCTAGIKHANQTTSEEHTTNHTSQRREMTGAEMVIQALIDQGVTDIFGYPGGAVLPIYDELHQQEKQHHRWLRLLR